MDELLKSYKSELQNIAAEIQESEELATYLDSEEENDYQALKDRFEPQIAELHEQVVQDHPLQIIAFEKALLDPAFENLFQPRILGYSVLRGEIDDHVKYIRPQNHFREVLKAICNSANFEILKKRIGQSIQVGFSLSSRIWIASLFNEIPNKKVVQYLEEQILPKYEDQKERYIGLVKYRKQFDNMHYRTAEFPESPEELAILFPSLKTFLLERMRRYSNNESFLFKIIQLLQNPRIKNSTEFHQVLAIVANYYDLTDKDRDLLRKDINEARKTKNDFQEHYFKFINYLLDQDIPLGGKHHKRVLSLLDDKIKDDMILFYQLMDTLYTKGYVHEDTINDIRRFHDSHEGLSTVNEVLRNVLRANFRKLLENLPESDYPEFFEYNKIFVLYMNTFVNQEFNQNLKEYSFNYVKKLLKIFTDKRGKDYQDIKRFVSTAFVDQGFIKEKDVVEMFKTKRKKKE